MPKNQPRVSGCRDSSNGTPRSAAPTSLSAALLASTPFAPSGKQGGTVTAGGVPHTPMQTRAKQYVRPCRPRLWLPTRQHRVRASGSSFAAQFLACRSAPARCIGWWARVAYKCQCAFVLGKSKCERKHEVTTPHMHTVDVDDIVLRPSPGYIRQSAVDFVVGSDGSDGLRFGRQNG